MSQIKTSKFLFFFSHDVQVEWHSVFAKAYKNLSSDNKTLVFVHGKKDKRKAISLDCYDIVVDLLDGFNLDQELKKEEAQILENVNSLEQYFKESFMWDDFQVDRWIKENANKNLNLLYYKHATEIIDKYWISHTPKAGFGEYTMAVYRYAYRKFKKDLKPMLYPVVTRYHERFYFETDISWQWDECIDNYKKFLKEGIPEELSIIANKTYKNITTIKENDPLYTEYYKQFPAGYTDLSSLGLKDTVKKILFSFSKRPNLDKNNIRDLYSRENFFERAKRVILERIRHYYYLTNIQADLKKDINYCSYFLHYQPEYTSTVLGKFYQDQTQLISLIASQLPANTYLLVKDHPTMIGLRKMSFYKKILSLPNVILIDHKIDSLEIIKNSNIVFTIVGTPALEAMFNGVPSIMFGKYAFSGIHSIKFCKSNWDLNRLIKESLIFSETEEETKKHSLSLLASKYFSSYPGSIPFDPKLVSEFMKNTKQVKLVSKALEEELKKRGIN